MTLGRRTPLHTRTPLGRGKPLERRKPLRATAGLVTRKPLGRHAPLRAKGAPEGKHRARASQGETFSAAVAALIDARDADHDGAVPVRLCQRCGSTRNLHRHHRRLKGSGGSRRYHTHCACAGVTVCLRCHDEIHAHPEQAIAEGWIVSRAVRRPSSVGVMRFAAAEGGATQWPSCDGRWLETAAEAGEAA